MALARKSSSLINIDCVEYRWAVSPDSGYMWLIVERADEPGQKIEAKFLYQFNGLRREITPGAVRTIVLHALAAGWQPDVRNHTHFHVDGEELVPLVAP